jgi:membrane-associated phospholipid phosphatase
LNVDTFIANWFHERLTQTFAQILHALSLPGDAAFIGIVLGFATLTLCWRRRWRACAALILTVPCGMLLGEGLKLLVQRPRPFLIGPFVDWSGYSFPSGHTIGATLLWGTLVAFALPRLADRTRWWRLSVIYIVAGVVLGVAFSRVALGAHYLTDVLAGLLLGLIWLIVCSRHLKRMPIRQRDDDESATTNLAGDRPLGPGGRRATGGVAGQA